MCSVWARLQGEQDLLHESHNASLSCPTIHHVITEMCACVNTWWRHQMETFSALLALCAGNSPFPGELPAQRPVTRSFDVFFDLRSNKRLSKQWRGWWFETQSSSFWRHCNDFATTSYIVGYSYNALWDLQDGSITFAYVDKLGHVLLNANNMGSRIIKCEQCHWRMRLTWWINVVK